ncbi:terpene synthase family protein [Streptomyces spectabilis]|uniref:Terpene synthase n=1 Tax=Streptomyces spectabilis TaxID=68270 RepID=A0A7W8F0R5_STRST|nr:terpene synthase family protein [Streptomyces spectabilis]MBB5110035.1 hypothetical protein [Streptomyces spectabilis]GGV57091.1 hypothetical protein GCM10010245_90160 [Streptomyces spectabilis]
MTRLELARKEYQDLAKGAMARYALRTAFDHKEFRIADYCADFGPNPAAQEAEDAVRVWARGYGMWLPGVTEHCIDLASYLYPEADTARLVTIGKNFAIDWYLNDTIGRDRVASLAPQDKQAAAQARERLLQVSQTLTEGPGASPVDLACLDMLREVRSGSSAAPEWFPFFLKLWVGNLQTMCRDCNASASGAIPTEAEYVETRTYISGMQHTIALGEFAHNTYLDWPALQRNGLTPVVRRLWWLCAVIGCLSNDLFSFEKEFIQHRSDSNIILVSILNDEHLTLDDAITRVIGRVRHHMIEYLDHARFLTARADELPSSHQAPLQGFIQTTQSCVKATWVWQLLSKRYKFPGSIFEETRFR